MAVLELQDSRTFIPVPTDVLSAGPEVSARYRGMVHGGMKPRLAEMLCLRKAPRAMTDTTFFADAPTLAKQYPNEDERNYLCQRAMAHGYTPRATDHYVPTLARFSGDPQAFIGQGDGLGDLKRRIEERGVDFGGDGTGMPFAVKGREPDVDPDEKPVKLAGDLVEGVYRSMVTEDPGLACKDKREICEGIVDKHTYRAPGSSAAGDAEPDFTKMLLEAGGA